jgi:hypothetical protein
MHQIPAARRLCAADHTQNFARGGLLLESDRELSLPRFDLVEQRTFSIAITACSANIWSRPISLAEKRPALARATMSTPIGFPSRIIGTKSPLRKPTARVRSLCV